MKHKAFMTILITTLIAFSFLLTSTSGTPTSRVSGLMKKSNKGKLMFNDYFEPTHEAMKVEENLEIEEEFIEGRMDFEKNDYSGVGANPEHDPKPPAGNV